MDASPITVTSVAVIAILVFMAVLACHYLSPKTTSWILSSKEETIRLSKNKLFNANGYLIHSGSDFLLSSSGSFKRFDSVDRDCKDLGQNTTSHMPLWNIPQSDIPPQPLRPAPAPIPSKISEEESEDFENEFITTTASINQQTHHQIKQSATINALPSSQNHTSSIDSASLRRNLSTPLNFEIKTATTTATAIPRPTIKRIGTAPNGQLINLSEAAFKIQQKGEEMLRSKSSTNPFLNQTNNQTKFAPSPPTTPLTTINELCQLSPTEKPLEMKIPITTDDNINKNPFTTVELTAEEEIISLPDAASVTIQAVNNDAAAPKEKFMNAIYDFINQMPASQHMSLPSNYQFNNSETVTAPATAPVTEDSGRKAFFQFRNRSFSETEATEIDLKQFCSNSNPFKRKGSVEIQKTTSEELLSSRNGNVPPFRRQSSVGFGIGRRNSSQTSLDSDKGSMDSIILQRAISCDSVNSESSVLLADLEQPTPEITGNLCVGLHCDKNTITNQSVDIVVNVMEVKEIAGYTNLEPFDTFVRIYLVPDQANAVQTKVIRDCLTPSFNETFTFQMKRRQGRHSLWFHLYHCGNVHTLIGESELEIDEIVRPMTTWLPLSDTRKQKAKWGELMFSLSYLPTAERLTVVVVKARNLKCNEQLESGNDIQGIFIKAYLLKDDKKVFKKKTSLKRKEHRCPIFNESMIFSIPPYALNTVHIRLTVMCSTGTEVVPLGHVIVGSTTTGKGLRHWHQMLSSLRKPVAMWHILRYASTNDRINDKKRIFIER
ncbi:uncharacterized protein LOC129910627 [Episyrphus balteatus]|uniref:uncharacterized protein LOC129910627 n=1 Tax=Episyrphus balteatus TaxID=286459 RepID=UPI00248654C7|nr:uncharacterized protein LOC129910627 [Episyrphus balteatus]XP_055844035.1 uncharacterized protein LOC129910627 [Episyrphus balteatus]